MQVHPARILSAFSPCLSDPPAALLTFYSMASAGKNHRGHPVLVQALVVHVCCFPDREHFPKWTCLHLAVIQTHCRGSVLQISRTRLLWYAS